MFLFLFFLYIIKNILNKESFELYGIYFFYEYNIPCGYDKEEEERKKNEKSENPFHWLAHAIGCGGKKEPPAACLLPCCSFIHRCPRGMNIASSCERYTFQRIICYVSKASQPSRSPEFSPFPNRMPETTPITIFRFSLNLPHRCEMVMRVF